MRRLRAAIHECGKPTRASALVALALATVIVVTQSNDGMRDVHLGVWWYEYYPFYTHSHSDAVTEPLALAVYGNLLGVTALLIPAVRIVEYVLGHELWDDRSTLGVRTTVAVLGLVVLLGVTLVGSGSALWILTTAVRELLRAVGLGVVVEVPSWQMSAQANAPSAAVTLCLLYALVRTGQRAMRAVGVTIPGTVRRGGERDGASEP